MTPIDAFITLAVFMFVVIPLTVAVCALSRIRNANESDRLGAALAPGIARYHDPAKTAGGRVGKRWDGYCAQTDGVGEFYTGGFQRDSYTFGPDGGSTICAGCRRLFSGRDALWAHWQISGDCDTGPEPDHHTLEEYAAIAADRELEAPHDAATKLP